MNLLQKTIIFISVLIAFSTLAQNKLTSLKVDGDIVYFSTNSAKKQNSPACMSSQNKDKWTLSLNTETGKASYALLVIAASDNKAILVLSANDCADKTAFERAQSIELDITANNTKVLIPVFKEVAYGFSQNHRGNYYCGSTINSNDENGSPYLNSNCSCTNGSVKVEIGGSSATNYNRLYFKCMMLAE